MKIYFRIVNNFYQTVSEPFVKDGVTYVLSINLHTHIVSKTPLDHIVGEQIWTEATYKSLQNVMTRN